MNSAIGLRVRLRRLEDEKCSNGVVGFIESHDEPGRWRDQAAELHAKGYRVVYVAHIPKRDATARREPDATAAR